MRGAEKVKLYCPGQQIQIIRNHGTAGILSISLQPAWPDQEFLGVGNEKEKKNGLPKPILVTEPMFLKP